MQLRLTGLTVIAAGASGLYAAPAAAQTIDLSVAIPRLGVAEYHRPYVAVYLQKEGGPTTTLAVWYDADNREGGNKWLNELRGWWRAAGRSMTLPADGISSATRAPGVQKLSFAAGRGRVPALTPGNYTLVVEAAREVGGREALRLPFSWGPSGRATATAQGSAELGAVTLSVHR